MVVLPLLYPDVFTRFDTQPPRGVLFTGPPGKYGVRYIALVSHSASLLLVSYFMWSGALENSVLFSIILYNIISIAYNHPSLLITTPKFFCSTITKLQLQL